MANRTTTLRILVNTNSTLGAQINVTVLYLENVRASVAPMSESMKSRVAEPPTDYGSVAGGRASRITTPM